MKKLYPLFLLLCISLPAWTQVTTDPEFPTLDEPVTITFDIKEAEDGRATALLDLTEKGDIFLWSGAGDEEDPFRYGPDGQTSWTSPLPEEFELTPLGNGVWEITLTPSTFYNIPEGANITRLGVLLKNADGTAQTEDFFITIYEQGLNLTINTPEISQDRLFTLQGADYPLSVSTNEAATIALYLNEELITTATGVTSLEEKLPTADPGTYEVRIEASTEETSRETSFSYQVVSGPQTAPLPPGAQPGLNINDDQSVTFVLRAPLKEFVMLLGDFNDFQPSSDYQMNRDPDGETFWLTLNDLDPDREYVYYYLVDGNIDVADPYSEKVLVEGLDSEIDNERYPGLRDFPEGAGTDHLTAFTINEPEYNWQTENYTRPKKEDLVIYELLVRDFTESESFQGVIDRLDYLDSLNITAIQLMPVMQYNGNNSWGYNPSFQTALDKWYGSKNKLKELVDKAHQRGMAVILDIALNHQDYPSPLVKMWWEGNRVSAENPYANVIPRHPFNVFIDLDHESPYTQEWVDRVNRYWIEEYRIDGYRFDLSKGFTQTNTGDNVGAWSDYDASRIALLKRMADQLWEVDEDSYVILEHFADNSEETELANYGMMLWGNLQHNYAEAIMGWQLDNNRSSFDWLSYQARGWDEPNVVGYIESHDEERLVYTAQEYGNQQGDYSTRELATALDRIKLAAAFFIPVPGPKMIWQFGELGYDISIDENGRTGKKPVRWDYLEEPERQYLFRTFSELNYLKTTYPVFETEDFEMPGTGEVRTLKLNGEEMNVLVVGNFGLEANTASVDFQQAGMWYSYFEKDSIEITGSNAEEIQLQPGEFRMYFDAPIFHRGNQNPLALEDNEFSREIRLYPNPAHRQISLEANHFPGQTLNVRILDNLGRAVQTHTLKNTGEDRHILSLEKLKPGFYTIEIGSGKIKGAKRIILY